ncbi:hypothetical protein [Bacillus cereus]|uniref:Uncharacterized protein n=1 Tax=Bacillus cereus TaxID=1396 RepID=A0AA44QBQ8_BACCE|nr:hypothetical protein [Bacillus cereus]PFN09328.1 hypothetical protein COJ55_03465 [Bacillus cereus]PFS02027.1 hypothetical protein COK38_10125 [Bacillus cereus]
MNTAITNQETFIIDANVRETYMNRIDVLEKVKGLLLLPNVGYATTKQVAEFYEVDRVTLNKVMERNKNELIEDGMCYKRYGEVTNEVNRQDVNLLSLGVSYRGTSVFPRRAILRVGMLLRDSAIAKEVRTQLLNIEEKATSEAKVSDISEEMHLQMAVSQAFASEDINTLAQAVTQLMKFKQRHITEIENKLQEQKAVIQTLAKEETQYKDPKKLLRKLVNHYSTLIHGTVSTNRGWIDLRRHLVNKLEKGINLKSRRTNARKSNPRASYISVIHPEEFKIIIPAMVGICVSSGVDVSDIMKDA